MTNRFLTKEEMPSAARQYASHLHKLLSPSNEFFNEDDYKRPGRTQAHVVLGAPEDATANLDALARVVGGKKGLRFVSLPLLGGCEGVTARIGGMPIRLMHMVGRPDIVRLDICYIDPAKS